MYRRCGHMQFKCGRGAQVPGVPSWRQWAVRRCSRHVWLQPRTHGCREVTQGRPRGLSKQKSVNKTVKCLTYWQLIDTRLTNRLRDLPTASCAGFRTLRSTSRSWTSLGSWRQTTSASPSTATLNVTARLSLILSSVVCYTYIPKHHQNTSLAIVATYFFILFSKMFLTKSQGF